MQQSLIISIVLLGSYLLGAIPFGMIVSRLYKVDITKVGSGNIGTTNILRTLGVVPAIIVFLGDFLKGFVPVYAAIALNLEPKWIISAGLLAVIGHTFSVFMKFKGGRGVATGLGVLLGIAPDVFLLVAILALIIMGFTRYVSLASIVSSIVAAVSMYLFDKPKEYLFVISAVVLLIIWKHIPNIQRLLKGEERKIGEKAQ